jgi:galacturan 1,4-alpha-galacturonidase
MLNAQNGARIKVWGGSPDPNSVTYVVHLFSSPPSPSLSDRTLADLRYLSSHSGGGSGYVRNVTFTNYEVQNVDYPIVITACYL